MKEGKSENEKLKIYIRATKTPNPTNFSNSRSNFYLGQSTLLSGASIGIGVKTAKLEAIKLVTEESEPESSSSSEDEDEEEEIKSVKPPKNISIQFPFISSITDKLPQTTKSETSKTFAPNLSICSKDDSQKIMLPFKSEYTPLRVQKPEKIEPKLLPIVNEKTIESPSDDNFEELEGEIAIEKKKKLNKAEGNRKNKRVYEPRHNVKEAQNSLERNIKAGIAKTGGEINETSLKQIVSLYKALQDVYDNLKQGPNLIKYCRQWWELADNNAILVDVILIFIVNFHRN